MAEGPNGIGTISRRRVLTGVAWATPAIVLAVATPPAAASEPGGQMPVGTLAVTGSGHRGNEGPPVNGFVYRVNSQNLTYSGEEYPATLVVGIEFPKAYVAQPPVFNTISPHGWLDPVELVDSGSVYRLTFTKDPNVSFQHYIPNFGGGSWIHAAPGAPAFTATAVVVSGTTPSGGVITGGGGITFS